MAQAIEAEARGAQFLCDAERETQRKAAEQEQSEAAAAQAIAAHLRAGNSAHAGVDSAEVASVLNPASRARAEAAAREAVVRASATALEEEVSDARANLASAEKRIRHAAYGVLAAEAQVLADELEKARAIVIDRRARLRALGRLPNQTQNLDSLPAMETIRRAVAVSHKGEPQYAFQQDPESQALIGLRRYFEALCGDAEAVTPE